MLLVVVVIAGVFWRVEITACALIILPHEVVKLTEAIIGFAAGDSSSSSQFKVNSMSLTRLVLQFHSFYLRSWLRAIIFDLP